MRRLVWWTVTLATVEVFLVNVAVGQGATCVTNGRDITCTINQPVVNRPTADYKNVQFAPGDTVTVQAGGCVQTGGSGKTWKRYVDPQGVNSDRLYHGLIYIPGMRGLRRISE